MTGNLSKEILLFLSLSLVLVTCERVVSELKSKQAKPKEDSIKRDYAAFDTAEGISQIKKLLEEEPTIPAEFFEQISALSAQSALIGEGVAKLLEWKDYVNKRAFNKGDI